MTEPELEPELQQLMREIDDKTSTAVAIYHLKHWTPAAKHTFYDHRFNWYRGPLEWQWLERAVYGNAEIADGANANVLDLCCGDGIYSRMWADRAGHVDGVDRNPLALRVARENWAHERVQFHEQDVLLAPFPRPPYQVVMWFAAIEHFACADIHMLLDKIGAALTPNGVLVGSTPAGGGSNPEHQCPFPNEEALEEMMYPHFAVVDTWRSRWGPNRVEMYFRCRDWRGPAAVEEDQDDPDRP
jgi:SAM-dependent methyltransferase